ncbi:hypothetical protein TNCV_1523051 [Trichonephila clavipes]|nr:hypothetical protein TNCV_1523051 [Trichonephila clavipes]
MLSGEDNDTYWLPKGYKKLKNGEMRDAWGYAADSNIKILEVAQNSLIRNIVKADRYTRNSKIYEDVKILPFKAYIQKLAISFFNNLPNINNENVKMLNNYIPVPDLKRPRRILLDSYNPP